MFLGIGGILGGVAFLVDPTGQLLLISQSILNGLPFQNFFLPGLILFLFLGISPLVVAYGLWHLKSWAWYASIVTAIVLCLWILLGILLFGYIAPFQPVFGLLGILMLMLCFWPPVRNPFRTNDK